MTFFFFPLSKANPVHTVVSGLAGVGRIQCWLPCLLVQSIRIHLQYSFSYCDTTATATSPLLLMELTKLLLLLTFNLQRFSWKNFAKTNKDIHVYKKKKTYLFDCCLRGVFIAPGCHLLMLTGKAGKGNATLILGTF